MSGQRCRGSSSGKGMCSILERDPVSAMISFAACLMVI